MLEGIPETGPIAISRGLLKRATLDTSIKKRFHLSKCRVSGCVTLQKDVFRLVARHEHGVQQHIVGFSSGRDICRADFGFFLVGFVIHPDSVVDDARGNNGVKNGFLCHGDFPIKLLCWSELTNNSTVPECIGNVTPISYSVKVKSLGA